MGASAACMYVDRDLLQWSREGDFERLQQMLSEHPGVNVNCEDIDGWTPLLLAIKYGHVKIVPLLLDAGANVKHKTQTGKSALLLATAHNESALINTLLKYGADASEVEDVYMTINIL